MDSEKNFKKYGKPYPPAIDLKKITGPVKVAMFVGDADDLGDPIDNRWAASELRKGGNALVHYEEMSAGHTSFMVGKKQHMTYVDRMIDLVISFNTIEKPALDGVVG